MRSHDRLRRSAVAIAPERTIQQVAELMDAAGVGAVAVIDDDQLMGIVTDRDLVRRALARGFEPDARVDSVMSSPVVTIDAEADLHDAFSLLGTHGIRRLAVVKDDKFLGMITVDDLLIDLAQDLSNLSRPIIAETIFGHHDSPVPAQL
jgi:signal-transduction protein with cAMP-binding, CBS, and nucleotidyltransferase domain